MRLLMAGVIAAALGLAGCATLTRGTSDHYAVLSRPPGAQVTTTRGDRCTTPCTLAVPRRADFAVTVSKPGYRSQTVAVTTRISGSGAAEATANVATAGLGLAVDAATGGMLEHVPGAVDVTLTETVPHKRPPPARAPVNPPADPAPDAAPAPDPSDS